MPRFNFVGEVGCNHLGSMELAKKHIDIFADFAKVKYIKFQKRTISDLLTLEEYNAPHPNLEYAHGSTYGQHREFLEFSIEQHVELYNYCKSKGVIYACSAWDVNSAKELVTHIPEMEYIKIPSACNLNFKMLNYIYDNFSGNVHISLGMTSRSEADDIVNLVYENGAEYRTVLYACTSGYPVEYKDVALLEITDLKKRYSGQRSSPGLRGIGFSGHHLGIAMDIAAATLGATWIERHIVTCRSTIRHTDAPASLEPDGVRRLVRDLDNLSLALNFKKSEILDVEQVQRLKLKRNA